MNNVFDLVIRNGRIIDGSGDSAYTADLGVKDAKITAIGPRLGEGVREIDANGALVTPGFVDIHTHYDGQITWENRLIPSSSHGVTTVVMGSCGVGFAPCSNGMRNNLIDLMAGVEDIPQELLRDAIPWKWQSFPDYLDFLSQRHCDVDFATLAPHSPIRMQAMGERGIQREPASLNDIAAMKHLVIEAIEAGALGFSTSRLTYHRDSNGRLAPTITASESELIGIARGLGELGTGVIEAADYMPDTTEHASTDLDMWCRILEASGSRLSFGLQQAADSPGRWRDVLKHVDNANRRGLRIQPQITARPIGILYGLTLSTHPFSTCPSYREIATLPLEERVEALRNPALKEKVLNELPVNGGDELQLLHLDVDNFYEMSDPPDYMPPLDQQLDRRAARLGISALELVYDLLLEHGGKNILFNPVTNFVDKSAQPIRAMIENDNTIFGLGDGGAHMGMVCDASMPSYILSYWARDAGEGAIPVEQAVKMLTADTAEAFGLLDRGLLKTGYKADINIIDHDKLRLHRPYGAQNLPTEGIRVLQDADGFIATILSGEITYRSGKATENLPGRLVRGARAAPV